MGFRATPKAWRERKVWREIAASATREAVAVHNMTQTDAWSPAGRCAVSVAFGFRTKRRRDIDNLAASLKPVMDGMVDGGAIVDDSMAVVTVLEIGGVVTGTDETVVSVIV